MSDAPAAYPRRQLEEFAPGFECTREFTVDRADVARFAEVSGDRHPLHRDAALATERGFPDIPVHGMLVAARSSAFIAHDIVGSHGLLVSMTSDFRRPVYCGEPLIWRANVTRVTIEASTVEVTWGVTNDRGVLVQRGTACAWLPAST